MFIISNIMNWLIYGKSSFKKDAHAFFWVRFNTTINPMGLGHFRNCQFNLRIFIYKFWINLNRYYLQWGELFLIEDVIIYLFDFIRFGYSGIYAYKKVCILA